jgi:hypothetical protein
VYGNRLQISLVVPDYQSRKRIERQGIQSSRGATAFPELLVRVVYTVSGVMVGSFSVAKSSHMRM